MHVNKSRACIRHVVCKFVDASLPLEREHSTSPLSSAQVKNAWVYISIIRLNALEISCRENYTFEIVHTGHTQKNGAVSKVNTINTAPFFCVYPVHTYTHSTYIHIYTLLQQQHVSFHHGTKLNCKRFRRLLSSLVCYICVVFRRICCLHLHGT